MNSTSSCTSVKAICSSYFKYCYYFLNPYLTANICSISLGDILPRIFLTVAVLLWREIC